MSLVESYAPEQETYWLVQPLVEAGLALEEIRDLVGRLGFEAVVRDGRSFDAAASGLVLDQPADVRAAWVETINRMITSSGPAAEPVVRPASPA